MILLCSAEKYQDSASGLRIQYPCLNITTATLRLRADDFDGNLSSGLHIGKGDETGIGQQYFHDIANDFLTIGAVGKNHRSVAGDGIEETKRMFALVATAMHDNQVFRRIIHGPARGKAEALGA